MLGVEERALLVEHLREGCPAGGAWDVLLFSGGGNDIVGTPMALWIKDWDPAVAPADHLHRARFDAALDLVRAGYEDVIALRDTLSPGTHLIFHCYDLAIPDGRGICHLGPWLKPTFDLRGFPTLAARCDATNAMLQRFRDLLPSLAATSRDATFIDSQGTLAPQKSSWHNELSPYATRIRGVCRALLQEGEGAVPPAGGLTGPGPHGPAVDASPLRHGRGQPSPLLRATPIWQRWIARARWHMILRP